ncbi:MAG: rhomboid family intramembrane serine protease [Candidatus Aminicenantes bacterium]|nr:MAG: rhomboid family intramembrane serine protease [Candidatus Aminicenantes bacterium]
MFFLLPIGHESDKVRRLPWVTFFIMATCLIVHIYVTIEINKTVKELESMGRELVNYYFQHPYLELDEETKKLLFGAQNTEQVDEMIETYREAASRRVHIMQEEEQEELDQLAAGLKSQLDEFPYRKWGFIPAKKTFMGLLTHMFIHGGWLHLLGNLLFLYLTGPFIEDVWGRPLFAGFYVISGVFAAAMYATHYPNFSGPLIGASGAIAGVMGAFLIRYFTTRIKFFYIFLLVVRGTFKAPAWLMMPLWLGLEVMNGKALDAINPGGGGVAHWAHVWGFVLGVVIAWGMKSFKVEEKYIHPKIESQISFVDEGFVAHDEALKLRLEGRLDEAYALLLETARKHPTNQDVVENLWNLGVEIGNENEAAEYLIRLIENEVRRDQVELALDHFLSLKSRIPQASISLTYKFTLMKHLAERQNIEEAENLANEILGEVSLNTPAGLLQNFASTTLQVNPSIAQKVIEICLQHQEIPEDQKDKLKADLDAAQKDQKTAAAVRDMQNVTTTPGIPPPSGSPVMPGTPGAPRSPTVPETSATPGSPMEPGRPVSPESSLATESPTAPGGPAAPDTSMTPGAPPAPGTPMASESPEAIQSPMPPESRAVPGGPAAPETPGEPEPGISSQPRRSTSAQKSIRVYKAIPLDIKEDKLDLNTEEFGQKSLAFSKVKAIAVAEISSPQDLPYELIDLFLEDPKTNVQNIKAVRLFTTGFNPRKFFPDMQDQNEALKALITTVLEKSSATPYPDKNSVLLDPPNIFGSILEYERSILS